MSHRFAVLYAATMLPWSKLFDISKEFYKEFENLKIYPLTILHRPRPFSVATGCLKSVETLGISNLISGNINFHLFIFL
jgi:hypothetical protein